MAARTRYAPDRGLTVRMTATMFLLGLVFVAFIAAIIGIGTAYGASSTAIVFFAVILGGGFAIGSLFADSCDTAVIASSVSSIA